MKNEKIKTLSDVLSEMAYFDKEKVEKLIETHFELWVSDSGSQKSRMESKIKKFRSDIDLLKGDTFSIEKQLIDRKLTGGVEWKAKCILALRVKKHQIESININITELREKIKDVNRIKTFYNQNKSQKEKQKRIEDNKIRDASEHEQLIRYVKDLIGRDEFIKLMDSFRV